MNYRHAFHAGNFADVVKHALLCRLIEYLKHKDKPFRVMDTHAGRGRYDLAADEALRTGEHEAGIAALRASAVWEDALLAPYRSAVEAAETAFGPTAYPGSPWIARHLLRRQDRLSAYELHPVDAKALAAEFAGDVQVKTIALDGWLALGAHLPPKERRGLVLIDPPFEEAGEFERIAARVGEAWRRWPGGTYAIWYPIKRQAQHEAFHEALAEGGMRNVVAADFFREPFSADERLVGTGFAVVNPPFTFAAEAEAVMRALLPVLGVPDRANCGIVALVGE
ncbi:23S rRNA (adenine(2030)-N(6))-methyltransferase RlmJ [Aureimonas flava]|uniref:Ribosomal RNA large subunit methyltransferase J n=1 Tax=Aureimonas flava TaxID=2320271 RepID=A0A3A1WXV4_9HYPH|nr:23S rRNA (adenine(2030)-N(6))-methyltransferase RlmJ [Aureimonas flava]RIY03549.1 23S rRNA (adenine(2030)-N(6))-methyltransferase RlmJ [Aureimonas flava]